MGWDFLLRFIIGLGFTMQIYYYSEICKNYFKIVKKKKRIGMTWPLMWRNMSIAILNVMLQLLVIYR